MISFLSSFNSLSMLHSIYNDTVCYLYSLFLFVTLKGHEKLLEIILLEFISKTQFFLSRNHKHPVASAHGSAMVTRPIIWAPL